MPQHRFIYLFSDDHRQPDYHPDGQSHLHRTANGVQVLNVDGEYMAATELMLPYRWTAPEGYSCPGLDFNDFTGVAQRLAAPILKTVVVGGGWWVVGGGW